MSICRCISTVLLLANVGAPQLHALRHATCHRGNQRELARVALASSNNAPLEDRHGIAFLLTIAGVFFLQALGVFFLAALVRMNSKKDFAVGSLNLCTRRIARDVRHHPVAPSKVCQHRDKPME